MHLNNSYQSFYEDEKLTPYHISLYFALFQHWNTAKFRNPISVSRDELMKGAKIGSVNTYTRCMKELHEWQYIQYIPSFNPQKGSQVYLYSFDKATNKTTDKGRSKAIDKANEKRVIPYTNSRNNTNKLNNTKEYEHTGEKNNRKFVVADSNQRATPTLEEIKNFFAERGSTELEAKKFFNYYQSNGWLVGKVPMKNWHASAEKWILNGDSFKQKPSTNKLHTNVNKNYNEPL